MDGDGASITVSFNGPSSVHVKQWNVIGSWESPPDKPHVMQCQLSKCLYVFPYEGSVCVTYVISGYDASVKFVVFMAIRDLGMV